jgi:hydrogenase-4 component B
MLDYGTLMDTLLFISIGGFGIGSVIGLLLILRSNPINSQELLTYGKNVGFFAAFVSSVATLFLALSTILLKKEIFFQLQTPLWGELSFHVDYFSAFFLLVISLLGCAVSLYSISYTSQFVQRRNIGLFLFLYNILFLSLIGIVSAGNAVLFLIMWEVMSLTVYFLIVFEHEDASTRKAGFLYVIMAHIGTAFLMGMFILLFSYAHSFEFSAMRGVAGNIPSFIRSIVFLCALIGFGVKAGIMPLHIWLPEAHPAAPSNISALMSGVVIKTGIYGIVRVAFDLLGPNPLEWWGILVLVIAVVSAVVGVLYALMEHDLKRLLAYHSIENIGIILMGVGAALCFSSLGNMKLAALALAAGLFHVLNHAIFKGLLFLGAGSVHHATGTRNIEELGGLMKRLPWTALFFLVGAVAISALPPLNGFASEWLTFQALLFGFNISDLALKLAIPLTVALLALTGALAAACFVKAFGITFLGSGRSYHVDHAHESPLAMIIGMAVLAVLCITIGIAPGMVLTVLDPGINTFFNTHVAPEASLNPGTLLIQQGAGTSSSPLFIALLLAGLVLLPIVIGVSVGGKIRRRIAMTWACGLSKIEPQMQYTATGFSKPIRMIFSNIVRATHEIEIEEETSPYFRPAIRYQLKTESIFDKYLYDPSNKTVMSIAHTLRRIQTGHLQTYLAYIFITLILLLIFAR